MKNVTRNLCEVVSRADSVAEFCRRVGINRQQFNKYLAGTHTPSARSMLKIAEVSGLTVQDFELDAAEFLRRVERKGPGSTEPPRTDEHFRNLQQFARSSTQALKPFLGTYFRYHHSSIFPGMVIRAVTVIHQSADLVRYATVEYMPGAEGKAEGYRFGYLGICYLMGNRVFMCDYEHRHHNEMTSTILMPQFRTPIRYMFGLLTGIASTAYGQPFATRVAFERKSDDRLIRKSVIRQATMLEPGDSRIPGDIRKYLGGPEGAVLMASP